MQLVVETDLYWLLW